MILTIFLLNNYDLADLLKNKAWMPRRALIMVLGLALTACGQQQEQISAVEQADDSLSKSISNDPYGRKAIFSYPDFSGNFEVASHSLILSDQSRLESFDENSIENRKVQIRFYYPTNISTKNTSQISKLPVIAKDAWEYLVGHQELAGKLLRYNNYRNAKWNISLDSPVNNLQPSYPVLIFSHGYGYSAESYSALSAELASKGYIVVSINHTYGANPSDFGNDDLVWAKPLLKDSTGAYLPIWSDDQIFVIDQLNLINSDPASLFFQKLDLTNLGVFGHSYGGAASYYSASRDPRIKAIIDIDGTIFDFEQKTISQPFAFILSKDHQPKYDFFNAGDRAYQLRLPHFEHSSFSDHILWWQWDHDNYQLGQGNVDAHRAVELTTNLVSDFFDTYLLSKETEWFQNGNVDSMETGEVILNRQN